MTFRIRNRIAGALVGAVFLAVNAMVVAIGLHQKGTIGWVRGVHQEYLTGTAVTIVVVLLFLPVRPGGGLLQADRRSPVCGRKVSMAAESSIPTTGEVGQRGLAAERPATDSV